MGGKTRATAQAIPKRSELLTAAEASAYLTISPRTLSRWASQGRIRRYYVAERRPLYAKADLDRLVVAESGAR